VSGSEIPLDLGEVLAGFKPVIEPGRHVRAGYFETFFAALSDDRIEIEFALPQIECRF
jgi:hypothetical protein